MGKTVLEEVTPFLAVAAGGQYHPDLVKLRGRKVSGVYAIFDADECLYVGESHSGQLYDTITRHFRRWRPAHDPQGRRVGGTTYDRQLVAIAYAVTPADQAQSAQYEEIRRLGPRDNDTDGHTLNGADLPV